MLQTHTHTHLYTCRSCNAFSGAHKNINREEQKPNGATLITQAPDNNNRARALIPAITVSDFIRNPNDAPQSTRHMSVSVCCARLCNIVLDGDAGTSPQHTVSTPDTHTRRQTPGVPCSVLTEIEIGAECRASAATRCGAACALKWCR